MQPSPKTVGQRIKNLRIERGETLESFGQRFKTSKTTVYNWEIGRNLPSKGNLKKIADIGGISVNELLYGQVMDMLENPTPYKVRYHDYNFPTKEQTYPLENDNDTHALVVNSLIELTPANGSGTDSIYFSGMRNKISYGDSNEGSFMSVFSEAMSENLFYNTFSQNDYLIANKPTRDRYTSIEGYFHEKKMLFSGSVETTCYDFLFEFYSDWIESSNLKGSILNFDKIESITIYFTDTRISRVEKIKLR